MPDKTELGTCFICGSADELIETETACGQRMICAECEQKSETNYDPDVEYL